jgi:uncharacterized protein (TIGR02246 family)
MKVDSVQTVSDLVGELERAWNAGDGVAFARPFAEDADFVNIRGEQARTRDAIAAGHLNAPTGPLAGIHNSLFTMVLVQDDNHWRIAAFHNTLVK